MRGLRLGITGSLGSGKSTVAGLLRARGAHLNQSDEVGRALMQPGQKAFDNITATFGPGVVAANGQLDRAKLAQIVFGQGRIGELNALIHPPVIAELERWTREVLEANPGSIAAVESALIFEAGRGGTAPGIRDRFDKLLLVTAPEEEKLARALARIPLESRTPATEADLRARLAAQLPDEEKIPLVDYVIDNSGSLEGTERQVDELWPLLQQEASSLA